MKCLRMLGAKRYLPKFEREKSFRKLDFEAGGRLIKAAIKYDGPERKEIMGPVANPNHRKGPWGIVCGQLFHCFFLAYFSAASGIKSGF